MNTTQPERALAIARHRIKEDVLGSLLVWGLFAAIVVVIGAGIAMLGTITSSVWEQASQLPRWYAGAVGVYFTAVYLPLYVAHGQTRREFARQIPPVIVLFAAVLALLMTVGFAVEATIYSAFDWPQDLATRHLYDAPTQLGLVFVEFTLLFAVWTVAGTVVGAGFYRHPLAGFALIAPALAAAVVTEAAVGPAWIVPLGVFSTALAAGSVAVAVGVSGAVFAVCLVAMWLVTRDMPLRNKDA